MALTPSFTKPASSVKGDQLLAELSKTSPEMTDEETCLALIEQGANVNVMDWRNGDRPLHIAVRRGHLRIAEALIAFGAMIDPVDGNDKTPLWMAADARDYDMIKLLLAHEANPNKRDNDDGLTPLGAAAQWGDAEAVRLLLDGGATPRAMSNPTLEILLPRLRPAIIRMFDEAEASIAARRQGGQRPKGP